jgi:hypothetical protein
MSVRRKCKVAGCDREPHGEFCKAHYSRWRKTGSPGGKEIRPLGRAVVPVAPLLTYLEKHHLTSKDIRYDYPSIYRQLWRATHITEHSADRFACHFAQVHPSAIWPDWYELTCEEAQAS